MKDIPPPAVRFPPPLLYAGLMMAGWLIGKSTQLPAIPLPALPLELIGLVLILLGLAINLPAFLSFRRNGENVIPWTESDTMIVSGVYRFTRNPMYLGMSLISFGLAFTQASWAMLFCAIIATIIIDRLVILREEAYLQARFGQPYLSYKSQVRRWL